MKKLYARTVLPLAAIVLVVTGCTSTQAGTPSPAATTSSGAATSGTSPAGPGGATTTSLDPCSLLLASDLTSYGTFIGPNKREEFGARSCGYVTQVKNSSDPQLGVDVNVRDTQTVDALNDLGGGITQGKVNGRRSALAAGSPDLGSCVLAMAVGTSSRVDVFITSATDTKQACDVATKVADTVEPRLPKG
jgi:hypothetical protein